MKRLATRKMEAMEDKQRVRAKRPKDAEEVSPQAPTELPDSPGAEYAEGEDGVGDSFSDDDAPRKSPPAAGGGTVAGGGSESGLSVKGLGREVLEGGKSLASHSKWKGSGSIPLALLQTLLALAGESH